MSLSSVESLEVKASICNNSLSFNHKPLLTISFLYAMTIDSDNSHITMGEIMDDVGKRILEYTREPLFNQTCQELINMGFVNMDGTIPPHTNASNIALLENSSLERLSDNGVNDVTQTIVLTPYMGSPQHVRLDITYNLK